MTVSLIISVTENSVVLPAVLASLRYQSHQDFEIIVASGNDQAVDQHRNNQQLLQSVTHVSAADETEALNQAVREASGDYLVFTSADRILHSKFIEEHRRLADRDSVVAGSCIELGRKFSAHFLDGSEDFFELQKTIANKPAKMKADGAVSIEEGMYVNPHGLFGLIKPFRPLQYLDLYNMSFHKLVYHELNGFRKVDLQGELRKRILSMGYSFLSARNLAVQYKLRPQNTKSRSSALFSFFHF